MKQENMDQEDTELRLGINISSGTTTRTEDLNYGPRRPVQGPHLQLNMFPLTSVLPPSPGSSAVLSASGTLPWKKTSPGIDGGSNDERSIGEAKAAIHRVPVSKRFDVKKFLAPCHRNEEAAAINVYGDCSTELHLGIRAEDLKSTPPRPVQGPPLDLKLFQLTSVLQPASGSSHVLPASGTLPWKNTSPGIDGGSNDEKPTGETKDAIHRVPVSKRFDVKKFLVPCHRNEEAVAINLSSSNITVDTSATQELENDRVCSRVVSDVEEEGSTKKKPRLSVEQYALLEESFSKNKLPTPNQREAFARELNLPTHQVDVWFQNKRARMKFNQREMDCMLLKSYNELLIAENIRLQKELQELRSPKLASPMCPSCQRNTAANNIRPFGLAMP